MTTTNGRTIELYGFRRDTTADEVKNYLENHTGDGTISTVNISKPKDKKTRFTFATVRFTSKLAAEYVVKKAEAEERLWFRDSYLKARAVAAPMRRRNGVERMENVKGYFGNLVWEDKMRVIWKGENWGMEFGTEDRKLSFHLSHGFDEYKMELPFENILGYQFYCPLDRSSKLFLIKLQGAPKIFKKTPLSSSSPNSKKSTGFPWIRDVDFTPSSSIGQSSALCLELQPGDHLPSFFQTLVGFKQICARLELQPGSSSSSPSDLVPIVQRLDIPFKILFKINSLVQHGYLPGPALDDEFFQLVDPNRFRSDYIEYALEKLFNLKECCYEPHKWLKEKYLSLYSSKQLPWKPSVSVDDGLVYIHRVQITPSKVYFRGPEANLSNRVVRRFSDDIDSFIRVSFVDEELDKIRSSDLAPRSADKSERTRVYDRIFSVLRNGIVIGEKKFEFLAFSASQLRDNSFWMFASREGLSASDIRDWMGDFSNIRNVAKYAARLGQSFGSSRKTLCVEKSEIEIIPDVEVVRKEIKYCFSDGIGKISEAAAEKVAEECGLLCHTPSAFQIRYAGFKGVVAIDPTSTKKLSLRDSMLKYMSLDTQLDVLSWSKYHPCYLNRQVINLLSTLGIQDHVFVKKQEEAIYQLDSILKDSSKALEVLELMSPGEMTNILKEMLLLYNPHEEPFLNMMLRTFRADKLLDLKNKSRIFVPKGRTMMGCLDETRTLEYGQVFVEIETTLSQWRHNKNNKNKNKSKSSILKAPTPKEISSVESSSSSPFSISEVSKISACSVCQIRRPFVGSSRDFSYAELFAATDGFSGNNFLSEGGFGSVYKGEIDGIMIAVKQHKLASSQGEKEFMSEVNILSKVSHENLVMLLGTCSEATHRLLLVYEYVCHGSLEKHLSRTSKEPLSWEKRMKIARGVARGLQYLHANNIIHRDMRPNNILITHDYESRLGDFGLARTQYEDSAETGVVGTLGYLAPEYAEFGKVSTKTDVYAFGVVLLQLITGLRTTDMIFEGRSLVGWARPLLKERNYPDLIDPRIADCHDFYQLFQMVHVAEQCLSKDPHKRITMNKVLEYFNHVMDGGPVCNRRDFFPEE